MNNLTQDKFIDSISRQAAIDAVIKRDAKGEINV